MISGIALSIHLGSHQADLFKMVIAAGTSSSLTKKASIRTPIARPKPIGLMAVSYTHLTLPTKRIV